MISHMKSSYKILFCSFSGTVSYNDDTFDEVSQSLRTYYSNLETRKGNKNVRKSALTKSAEAVKALSLCHNVTPVYDTNDVQVSHMKNSNYLHNCCIFPASCFIKSLQSLHNISPISEHIYQYAVNSKLKSESTLRGCENQCETLRKIVHFKKYFFPQNNTIATFYTARNLFAFSRHSEILDLYYKGTII